MRKTESQVFGPLIIIGCGGYGREVWAILRALQARGDYRTLEGFVDDAPSTSDLARVRALGSTVIGSVADLATREVPFEVVIAVGSPSARERIHTALAKSPVRYAQLIHPDTTVGEPVTFGDGVIVSPGARLSTNITVGNHVHIDQNVTVGHDAVIEDFARLNPQACISGSVRIGLGALIGASATILQGLRIGNKSIVGAGACVVNDVPDGVVVKGVPAR